MKISRIVLGAMLCAFFLPVASYASGWTQMNEDGFGDDGNLRSHLIKQAGELYSLADNEDGLQGYMYDMDEETWTAMDSSNEDWGILADAHNETVESIFKFKSSVFVAIGNEETGIEAWRLSKQGEWIRVNEDGFGYGTDVVFNHFIGYKGDLYAFIDVDSEHSYILRWMNKNEDPDGEGMQWEEVTELEYDTFQDLDAVGKFKGEVYIANGHPAQVYKTADMETFEFATELPSKITHLSKNGKGKRMYAAGSARRFCYEARQKVYSTADGEHWYVLKRRPRAKGCYTKVISKKNTKRSFFLSFNTDTGVLIKKDGKRWKVVTKDGFEDENNRYFTDAMFYKGKLFVTTENEETGTEVWSFVKD